MIFILSITVIFVLLTIFFFFRAEKLHQQLKKAQFDSSSVRKENKSLIDSLVLVASRQEAFSQNRLQQLKELHLEKGSEFVHLKILTPLINNYAIIFRGCLKGKGQLSVTCKKCYENTEPDYFREFSAFINQQDVKIKRMWKSNTLTGFISLVEALLMREYEQLHQEKIAKAG